MEKEKSKKVILDILSYVAVILIVLLIKRFIFSPIRVSGDSMNNTLADKDIMILDEISYRFKNIKRYDIVVIRYHNEYLIKRVIALPGEKIKCSDGVLYINDKEVDDEYAYTETKDFEEVVVPKGEYFAMGDNRGDSLDSRAFGTFNKEDIRGRAVFTIYPFDRFGSKK